jgi:hypothetical protein
MGLARIVPGPFGFEIRKFESTGCLHFHTATAKTVRAASAGWAAPRSERPIQREWEKQFSLAKGQYRLRSPALARVDLIEQGCRHFGYEVVMLL